MEEITDVPGISSFDAMVADIISRGAYTKHIAERIRMDTSLPSIKHIQFYEEEE